MMNFEDLMGMASEEKDEAKETRTKVSETADTLLQIFNNNFVAYYRSHVAHVNIVGRNFYSDHKLLGGIYEDLQDQIDTIAELLRTLQSEMPCDLTGVLERSEIDSTELAGDADFLLSMVEEDLEYLVGNYRDLINVATAEGQDQIANYAQDRITTLEKSIWMINSTLGV